MSNAQTELNFGTKKRSYYATLPESSRRRGQIMDALREHGPMTRAQLAKATKIRLSSVCGRVRELLDSKVIYVSGEAWDEDTKRSVEQLSIGTPNDKDRQS